MISVLYVDDDPALLEIGSLYLERAGDLRIDTALSAKEGLEKIADGVYDIVISDYQMPGMDGIAFLKVLRASRPDLPFIIFTGRGREEVVIEALNSGADHYIQKGGDVKSQFAELVHTIRSAVERKRAQDSVIHLSRLYSVISRTNRAIIHIRDRQQLLEEACRIAVEEGKFLMAWIGLVDPATLQVHPAAACGYEAGYLSMLTVTADNVPQGMGLTGQAIREDCPTVCNDIRCDPRMDRYREEAARRGYCSSAGFPLKNGSTVVGAMRFYSGECNFFSDRELALLQELTDDISFALEGIERDCTLGKLKGANDALARSHSRLGLLDTVLRHDIPAAVTGLVCIEDRALAQAAGPELLRLLAEMKETTERIRGQVAFTGDYLEIGKRPVEWQDLHAAVSRAAAAAAPGVRIVVLPDDGIMIRADPMLEKVFFTLIDNALRYGGEKLSRIAFSSGVEGTGLVITCGDDGAGVMPAEKEKIFSPGYRKNAGQGLFLAREILGISGIAIRETGTYGSGARFDIVVPEGTWRRAGDRC